ncbi:guanitoxin biosynthesis heme-dependent pre-guanitoxin N-hydroxylase GntA [Pinirhizobacter soli]|uniref:guanitoxin biosynthesis heme-dependent pre-guanitoxin N-hydroxylase GntA n=1 Tax=Pinirhizobacter soli TaxID=2786953 RepID=UPI00202A21BB|nr:guanitoxin biosynthesis heme-dependent pre-guanitoxin N-hydroxylase GntA [Pinirhizobacter soli]
MPADGIQRDDGDAIALFRNYVQQTGFPCLAARTATENDHVQFLLAGSLESGDADDAIVAHACAFATDIESAKGFHSLAVLFPRTPFMDEAAFEHALWLRLQALHAVDARTAPWDPSVSDNPASPDFSFSLGGHAFYVVGLHPASSRRARRFPQAALVLNLHSQFEALREDGRYERFQQAIMERDVAFSGSANPMLAMHGEGLEAPQYSGREVDADHWRCPFQASKPAR